MSDDIVTRLRAYNIGNIAHEASSHMEETLYEAADEIERLRQLSDSLAHHLEGYVCHCQMSKCKCGYDDLMDEYREVRGG